MNERCKYIGKDGYRCGSCAFNLYKDDIDQGELCDVHYWQERALKAVSLEREACAKLAEQSFGVIGSTIALAIRARGEA
jgi:hypothetical protein